MLGADHHNVCVVGDSDQSIYGLRGADIRNILEFEEAFPDAAVIPLEQNYRSTKTILDAANAVIANNVTRVPKELWTDGERGEPHHPLPGRGRVRRGVVGGHRDRAAAPVSRACAYGDVAVFYRTNAQSRALEEELVRAAIPYKVVGGTRFYDRREVKDLLAYLRVVANPSDEVSARRIVNVPRRGWATPRWTAWPAGRAREGRSFADALEHVPSSPGVTGKARAGAWRRSWSCSPSCGAMTEPGAGPGALVEAVAERTGYRGRARAAPDTLEAHGRLENIAELAGAAAEYDEPRRVPRVGGPRLRRRRARGRPAAGCRS